MTGHKRHDEQMIYALSDALAADQEQGNKDKIEAKEGWVSFRLSDELYALPVEQMFEAVRVSDITPIPHAPVVVRGVTSLRGRVIPVVDLRVRLRLPATAIDRSSRILVVESVGRQIGLLVDEARQLLHIPPSAVEAVPDDSRTRQSHYLRGLYRMGESLVILLELDHVLRITTGYERTPDGGPISVDLKIPQKTDSQSTSLESTRPA